MAAGNFTTGATNYYFYSGSWAKGNVITSATQKKYSDWNAATANIVNPSDNVAWIQIYKINFDVNSTYNTASFDGWVGSSSNTGFSDNVPTTASDNPLYSYQSSGSSVTFGATTTNTGTISFNRSNGTVYGTIKDSHSNTWDGDIRATIYYYSLPAAPTGLTATVNSPTLISLSWTAPTDVGGATLLGYRIEYSTNSGATWNAVSNVSTTEYSTETTYSFAASPSTSYQFRVAAITDMVTRLRTARSIPTASGPFTPTLPATVTATTGALVSISFPDVSNKGYSYASAVSVIQSNGFTGTASQTTISSGANYTNYSTVGTQSVTAGTTSTNPDTRSYSLGVYAANGTIPNVVGLTQASATTSITNAGFASPTITTTSVGATPSNTGTVASQSSVGSQSYGTVVTLVVYSYRFFGSRQDATVGKTPLTTGKRYGDNGWQDLVIAKRYDATLGWIDISNG